ncbi:MAG: PilZ domain-containing protein [Candidatus Aminicenantes bacterium]|jgi:Tfp pilus assembly protein PilZ
MKKVKKNIVLIVDNEERKSLYNASLTNYKNVSIERFKSASEFRDSIYQEKNYSGFIIDLRTLIRTKPGDKSFLYELTESFPVMHISHSLDKKTIKGNIGNNSYNDKKLFDYFFNDLCPRFSPRGLRAFKRKNLYLNVYLALSPDASGDELIKANTSDISEGGCFVITPHAIPKDNSRDIYVIPKGLADQCPITCTVKWVLPWGLATRHLPGVGVAFKNLSESQREEIRSLIRKTLTKS